ncbi:MAG: hypothetical protein EBR82_29020 [Caulobacteraceae bacterium]|nr:hypothetical protein [Caulobacteraceae bacterium]
MPDITFDDLIPAAPQPKEADPLSFADLIPAQPTAQTDTAARAVIASPTRGNYTLANYLAEPGNEGLAALNSAAEFVRTPSNDVSSQQFTGSMGLPTFVEPRSTANALPALATGALESGGGLALASGAARLAPIVAPLVGVESAGAIGALRLLGSVAGFVGGSKATGKAIEQIYPEMAAAAAQDPQMRALGAMGVALAPAPGAVDKLTKAAEMVADQSGRLAAIRFVGSELAKGAALGAGTEAAIRGASQALGDKNAQITPEGLATAAGLGALLAGQNLRFRDVATPEVAAVLEKGARFERAKQAVGEDGVLPKDAEPLSQGEQQIFNQAVQQLGAQIRAVRPGERLIPEGVQIAGEQVTGAGTTATRLETRVPVGRQGLPSFDDLTPPAGGAPGAPLSAGGAPGPDTVPPSPRPAERGTVPDVSLPVVPGAPTVVYGTKGAEIPARYAWVPSAAAQTSHRGELMAPNPDYRLTNTRDYSQPAEADKQLEVLQQFNPLRHVTDATDAAVGPSIVGTVIDESGQASLQRFGGNSRGYAIQNLPPERRAELRALENERAARFGLEPTDQPDAELVRHIGTFDFRQPGERERAQAMVDQLNPSPGRVQGTAERARIDAEAVPPDLLATTAMETTPAEAQSFVRQLIAQGHADRNLTSAIAGSPEQSLDYVQRLLVNGAFREARVAEVRSDPRAATTTVRGMIDAAVPALVRMRALPDAVPLANAITRAYTTTLGYLDADGGKVGEALDRTARQAEFDPASQVASTVAQAMREAIVPDSKGRPLVEPTVANWRGLFDTIAAAVARHDPSADLFGNVETPANVVQRAVAAWRQRGSQPLADATGPQRTPPAVPQPTLPAPVLLTQNPGAESASAMVSTSETEAFNGAAPGLAEQTQEPPAVNTNPQAEAIAEARREIADAGPDYSPLSYADDGNPYVPVPLVGLPNIRIVEMPEMVALVQELGAEIMLGRMRKARGMFQPLGSGRIKLDPRIFSDYISAAKTLMHEIGHLIQYLPDKNLKRGNLWGHLYSLRNYMQEKFGSSMSTRTNADFREELIALTKYWKPYDPATVPPSYVAYRESAVELYADFISVLYNSPATAKAIAPKFFAEFFRGLDTKPEVKRALLELQAWLHKPVKTRLADRALKVSDMFAKGEALFLAKWEERQQRYAGFRGWASRLKQATFDHFAPIRDRAAATGDAQARAVINQLFDTHPLASNAHWRWLERLHRQVIDPAEADGISMDELGQWLFFDRIANENYPISEQLAATMGFATGGRTVIANPLGQTPKTARDQLLITRLNNGPRRQTLLESAVNRFHDEVLNVMREARDVGLLTPEQWAIIEGNAQHYAAFTPLEYVDTFVPAGFFHQAGTFKEIANPFISTTLKVLQMQRAIQFQRIKTGTVQFLTTHSPAEIERAETRRGLDGRETPVPPRIRGIEQIMVRENGKPVWYNVPAEIAAMFTRPEIPLLESMLSLLDVPFRQIFYPLFISYNPVFQFLRNPIRDLRRTYINSPGAVGFWSLARQLPLIKSIGPNDALAQVRALVKQGNAEPLLAEMIANLAITPGEATFAATAGKPVTAFDRILEQHGLLPSQEQPDAIRRLGQKLGLGTVLDMIQTAGRINELLPKVVVYKQLRGQGWKPKDASYFVRNYIGTPNFTRRGTHIGLVNSIIPFINIWQKGWTADLDLARRGFRRYAAPDRPGKSAAAWWMRWAMTSGIWTMLKVAAGVGLLGAGIKKLMDGIGQFDKANYDVIPIGHTGESDFELSGKVAYLKIPKDPTDRLLAGITYNTLSALAAKAAKQGVFGAEIQDLNANADDRLGQALTKNLALGTSDMPGITPLLTIGSTWKQYLSGQNPIDDFRGQHILSDDQFLVGGWESAKPMLTWTLGQSGINGFVRFDPNAKGWLEISAAGIPIVNGMVRISDYGYREQQLRGEKLEDAQSAAIRLGMPTNARTLNTELSFLRGLGAPDRTPAQEERYQILSLWHSAIWKPAEQQLRDAQAMGLTPTDRKSVLQSVEQQSQAFQKQ